MAGAMTLNSLSVADGGFGDLGRSILGGRVFER